MQAVAQFRPKPGLTPSSHVLLIVALTKVDTTNCMFVFSSPPEGSTISQEEWKEEEIVIEPGDGLMWRGDAPRQLLGEGHGGVMLMLQWK